MHDILGYVFGWILNATVPTVRRAWGNRGCLLASVVTAVVLVGLVSAYVLYQQGEDWKTWLILGPLTTVRVLVMVTTTYGLARGSRSETEGTALEERFADQEPAIVSTAKRLATQDIEITRREIPSAILRYFQPAPTDCPHCGREISSRAIICKYCDRHVQLPKSTALPGAEPDQAPRFRCARCGAPNPPDSSFCGECGAGLQDSHSPGHLP
ncbi:MAG: zinc ribbon domain-containing protein [Anaerolineae bacterium]|jgi:hypothetical protein